MGNKHFFYFALANILQLASYVVMCCPCYSMTPICVTLCVCVCVYLGGGPVRAP